MNRYILIYSRFSHFKWQHWHKIFFRCTRHLLLLCIVAVSHETSLFSTCLRLPALYFFCLMSGAFIKYFEQDMYLEENSCGYLTSSVWRFLIPAGIFFALLVYHQISQALTLTETTESEERRHRGGLFVVWEHNNWRIHSTSPRRSLFSPMTSHCCLAWHEVLRGTVMRSFSYY